MKLTNTAMLVGAMCCSTVWAGEEEVAKGDATLAEAVAATNEQCGATLDVTLDWKSFAGKFDKDAYFDEAYVGEHCATLVRAFGDFCARSERHQQAVADALTSITCRYDPKATRDKLDRTDVTWRLKKKAVTLGYNAETREHGQMLRLNYFEFTFLRDGGPGEEKHLDAKLQKDVEPANEACGKKFDVKIDWKGFRKRYRLEKGSEQTAENVYSSCSNVVATLKSWCEAEDEFKPRHKAVKKRVNKLTCKWDAKATRKKLKRPGASHKMKGKHLVVGWNWGTENPGQEVNDFFLKRFKIKDPHGDAKGKLNRARRDDWKRCDDACDGNAKCKRRCKKKHRVR